MFSILKLNKKRTQRGSFLIEALLTVTILSVGLTLIIQSHVASLRATVYSADYSVATVLLENILAGILRTGSVDDGFVDEGDFAAPYEKFHYTIEGHHADHPVGTMLNEVTVTISWMSGRKQKNVRATTYAFGTPS